MKSEGPKAVAPQTVPLPQAVPQTLHQAILRSVPGYELQMMIGKGAFSECWLAKHLLTGRRVAIKVVPRAEDYAFLEREITIWKDLDHPNIIQLYEVIPKENAIYLSMEYAKDGEVFDYLKNRPTGIPEKDALSIFAQLCLAIKYMHDNCIAHRDIKLENILLTNKIVKLADFGFSTQFSTERPCQEWLGSPDYSAPEILRNEPYDPRKSDSWSLGVVLFALMTGYLPFSRSEDDDGIIVDIELKVRERVLQGNFYLPASIPKSVQTIIINLLQDDPKSRWSTEKVLESYSLQQHIPICLNFCKGTIPRVLVSQLPGVINAMQSKGSNLDATRALWKIMAGRSDDLDGRSDDNTNGLNSGLDGASSSSLAKDFEPGPDENSSSWKNVFGFLPWPMAQYRNVENTGLSSAESSSGGSSSAGS